MKSKKNNMTSWKKLAQRVLRLESEAVALQVRHVDEAFLRAAQLIARCSGRVILMGIGKSGLIGRKLAATFSSTGTPSFFVHPTESMHGDLGMVIAGDVVLALSYSGETEEMKRLLSILKSRKLPLIAMTGRPGSMLGKSADVVVHVNVQKEACPLNIAPTSSTTAMLAMGDALALCVMEMKGFDKDDFARLHPGGALGKRLTLRVRDMMHQSKENPLMLENETVEDALEVMTQTRMGAASIVDRRGRLTGVFTDGDLRRGLQKEPSLLTRKVGDVMTRSPRTIGPDDLVADVAALFKKFGLDNFPVVDKHGKPVGILDEKDLLEEGMM